MAADDFANALRELGVTGPVRVLPESARTAATAAEQLGCEVGAIANSLVFAADGSPLLVMTSGAHRVDTSLVAALTGAAEVVRADAQSVRSWTGQVIGGVGPVGHPAPLRTLVDVWLAKYDVVWAAAGHPHAVFPTSYDELLRITGGISAEVGALSGRVPWQRSLPCLARVLPVSCPCLARVLPRFGPRGPNPSESPRGNRPARPCGGRVDRAGAPACSPSPA